MATEANEVLMLIVQTRLLRPLLPAALLLLGACGSIPVTEPGSTPAQTAATAPSVTETTTPALPERSFEPETLYSLLVGEIAGQRGRLDVLLHSYLRQAEKTDDPGVARRAARGGRLLT